MCEVYHVMGKKAFFFFFLPFLFFFRSLGIFVLL